MKSYLRGKCQGKRGGGPKTDNFTKKVTLVIERVASMVCCSPW